MNYKLEIGQKVFVVFQAKRKGHKKNLVFKGEVTGIMSDLYEGKTMSGISVKEIRFRIKLLKCMNEKDFIMSNICENVYCWEREVDSMSDNRYIYKERKVYKVVKWIT